MKQMEPEIKFLHLTQSLELLHKLFYETDREAYDRICRNTAQPSHSHYPRWVQIMRYHHLLEIAETAAISIPLGVSATEFADRLTKSRNYYTHNKDNTDVWNHMQLPAINSTLRIWVRSLILNQLGVKPDVINKAIRRDHSQWVASDIFSNKYSMRYENDFTL